MVLSPPLSKSGKRKLQAKLKKEEKSMGIIRLELQKISPTNRLKFWQEERDKMQQPGDVGPPLTAEKPTVTESASRTTRKLLQDLQLDPPADVPGARRQVTPPPSFVMHTIPESTAKTVTKVIKELAEDQSAGTYDRMVELLNLKISRDNVIIHKTNPVLNHISYKLRFVSWVLELLKSEPDELREVCRPGSEGTEIWFELCEGFFLFVEEENLNAVFGVGNIGEKPVIITDPKDNIQIVNETFPSGRRVRRDKEERSGAGASGSTKK